MSSLLVSSDRFSFRLFTFFIVSHLLPCTSFRTFSTPTSVLNLRVLLSLYFLFISCLFCLHIFYCLASPPYISLFLSSWFCYLHFYFSSVFISSFLVSPGLICHFCLFFWLIFYPLLIPIRFRCFFSFYILHHFLLLLSLSHLFTCCLSLALCFFSSFSPHHVSV